MFRLQNIGISIRFEWSRHCVNILPSIATRIVRKSRARRFVSASSKCLKEVIFEVIFRRLSQHKPYLYFRQIYRRSMLENYYVQKPPFESAYLA